MIRVVRTGPVRSKGPQLLLRRPAGALPGRLRKDLKTPTLAELATNFAGALARWAGAGFRVVDRAVYEERLGVCGTCQHWDAGARAGLGRCSAPGCGCTRLKHWLASERCPLRKWSASAL